MCSTWNASSRSSAQGATERRGLAFLAARFLFRDAVQARFVERLKTIDAGIAKEGAPHLFTLRLVPLFPFFLINLVMGLTALPIRTFYWVSQLGMLPGTLVYVNAGTELAQVDSLSGILSFRLLASFALLGMFPLLAKTIVALVKARRVYARWPKPAKFNRNLVVIGAGSAGLVVASIAAAVKAKVTLIEKHQLRCGADDALRAPQLQRPPRRSRFRNRQQLSSAWRVHRRGMRGEPWVPWGGHVSLELAIRRVL